MSDNTVLLKEKLGGKYNLATESLLIALAVVAVCWYLNYLWSRRKWYRCAKQVPGPFAFPVIGAGYLFMGSPSYIFDRLVIIFKTYGDISHVWFGTRLFYTVCKPEYIETILNSQKAIAKEELYKYTESAIGHGLLTAPVPIWKNHRKLIAPAFNQKVLDSFVEVFSAQTKVLVNRLQHLCGKEIYDMYNIIAGCTLDIISETAMGFQLNVQDGESKFAAKLDRAMELIFMRMFVLPYHSDFLFNLTPHAPQLRGVVKYLTDFMDKIVIQKRKEFFDRLEHKEVELDDKPKRKAFLDHILELSVQDGKAFNNNELRDEVFTFLIAGTDTTATTMSFALTMLGMHPEVQQKMYEEVLEVVGPEKDIEPSDIPQLKYMDRVIKETLRLFPPGAIFVRAIEDDLPLTDKITLPAGSSVVVGAVETQRSEKYWKDPLIFNPDRFLPEEVAKRHPCTFIPFSFGPRGCIGMRYSMMAMKCMLSTLIRPYKLSCSYKSIADIRIKTNIVLRASDGFRVTFEKRN